MASQQPLGGAEPKREEKTGLRWKLAVNRWWLRGQKLRGALLAAPEPTAAGLEVFFLRDAW